VQYTNVRYNLRKTLTLLGLGRSSRICWFSFSFTIHCIVQYSLPGKTDVRTLCDGLRPVERLGALKSKAPVLPCQQHRTEHSSLAEAYEWWGIISMVMRTVVRINLQVSEVACKMNW